ncbi:BspA family leucine-rich repeat surface protein [Arenicellales bacterium IMCC56312]
MPYQQLSRHLAGASVLSLVLIIAGCSSGQSTTGSALSKEATACYSEYVDLHGDIKKAYKAQMSTGIASQSAYGEAHYQTMGASEGRQLPQSCEALLVVSDSCYESYVDNHSDLTIAHQASGQTKAAFGQNHFNNHGVNGSHKMPKGCSTLYVPPVDKSTWAGSSYTDAQFEAYVNAHPDLLARYNAGNRSESIAQWGRKHYAYFGAGEGRSSGLVTALAAMASSGSGGGGGCTPPGTAITDANLSAAITDWIASGNASEYGDITQWCTGNVTNMSWKFFAKTFNEDISGWDVSNVTNMERMFAASSFNRSLNSWDVSSVENMKDMFSDSAFNGDISGWNTSSVTSMEAMFRNTSAFNGNIGNWNVSAMSDMEDMFKQASAFDQDIGNWNVSNVTNMNEVFQSAPAFNQDVSGWDTGSVTDMGWMFANYSGGATAFNQNLSGWNVSSLTRCTGISTNATSWTNSSLKPGGLCAGQ